MSDYDPKDEQKCDDYSSADYALSNLLSRLARYRDATKGALIRCIGFRGATLLMFGLYHALYALSLFTPPPRLNTNLAVIATIAPLWFWGTLWAIAAVCAFVFAFRRNDRIGYAATIAVQALWGTLYLGLALFGIGERSWVGAAIFLPLAGWLAIESARPESSRRNG